MKHFPRYIHLTYGLTAVFAVMLVLMIRLDLRLTSAQSPWTSGPIQIEYGMDPVAFLGGAASAQCDVLQTGCLGLTPPLIGYDNDSGDHSFITQNNRYASISCFQDPPEGPNNCYGIFAGQGGTERIFARQVKNGLTSPFPGEGDYYITFSARYDAETNEQLRVYICEDDAGVLAPDDELDTSICTEVGLAEDLGDPSTGEEAHTCTFPLKAHIEDGESIIAIEAGTNDPNQSVNVDWYQISESPPPLAETCQSGVPVGSGAKGNVTGWAWIGSDGGFTTNDVGWVNLNCENEYDGISESRCAAEGYTDFGIQAYWGNTNQNVIPICGEAWIGDGDPFQTDTATGTDCASDPSKCRSTGWMTYDPMLSFVSPDGVEYLAQTGHPDIFEVAYTGGVGLFQNLGNGTFTRRGNANPQGIESSLLLAHLDETAPMSSGGELDLIVGIQSGGPKLYYRNNGSGAFPLGPVTFGRQTDGTQLLRAGDFDEDGTLDVFDGTGANLEEFIWLNTHLNQPGGPGANPSSKTPIKTSKTLDAVVADFQRDGHLDLFVLNDGETPHFYSGFGDGTFGCGPPPTFPTDCEPFPTPLKDFKSLDRAYVNEDDRFLDVLFLRDDHAVPGDATVEITTYDPGTSTFVMQQSIALDPALTGYTLRTGYFNDDRYVDFVVAGTTSGASGAFVYTTNGSPLDFTAQELDTAPAVTDTDGLLVTSMNPHADGTEDVFLANSGSGPLDWNVIFESDGAGNFTKKFAVSDTGAPVSTRAVSVADWDGDSGEHPRRCTAAYVTRDLGPYPAHSIIGWGRIRSLQEYGTSLDPSVAVPFTSRDWGWVNHHGDWCASNPDDCVTYVPSAGRLIGYAWSGGGTVPGDASSYLDQYGLGWVDFSFGTYVAPYLTTETGDVYTLEDIGVFVPSNAATPQYGSTFLIQASGAITGYFPSFGGPNFQLEQYGIIPFPDITTQFRNVLGQIDYDEIVSGNAYTLVTTSYSSLPDGVSAGTKDISGVMDSIVDNVLENTVYYFSCDAGDCNFSVDSALTFSNATANTTNGNGMIVIEGDLVINSPVTYTDAVGTLNDVQELASLGWIVKGDVTVDTGVAELVGAFIVLGCDLADCTVGPDGVGAFDSGVSDLQLVVRGLIMAKEFQFQRTFIGDIGEPEPAEIVTYDGRVFVNPPPGMEDFTRALPEFRLIAP